MICIGIQFLRLIGLSALEDERRELLFVAGGGLAFSPLFSFGGGGNRRYDLDALKREPAPRRLLLVGMADRYGAASSLGSSVVEMCTDGHMPSEADAAAIASDLETCTHPLAAQIRARLLQIATPSTSDTVP